MTVVNVTSARKDLYGLVSLVQDHETVTITSKDGNAVLISEEDWDAIMETLYIMGDPDFQKNLEDARSTPIGEREVWNWPILSHYPRSHPNIVMNWCVRDTGTRSNLFWKPFRRTRFHLTPKLWRVRLKDYIRSGWTYKTGSYSRSSRIPVMNTKG